MTYKEILERAAFLAHKMNQNQTLDRLRTSAEAIFPSVVEELAIAVAMNPFHPWRAVLRGVTASVASGALIPQTSAVTTLTGTADPTASTTLVGTGTLFLTELVIGDQITVNGETRSVSAIASNLSLTVTAAFTDTAPASITKPIKQIIGVHGIVKDATDSKALTESFAIDEIRALIDNINSWRQADVYAYQIVPPRIYHTRTNVVIDVCVYDVAVVKAAIAANAVPLFPDAEGAYVSALVAKLDNPATRFDVDYQGQIMVIKEGLAK